MKCHDVLEELAVPSGLVNRVAIDVHLRTCPTCAARAIGFERLDHAWQATRPAEPRPDVFQQLWSRVEDQEQRSLRTSPGPRSNTIRGRLRMSRHFLTGISLRTPLAAAALILIAVSLSWLSLTNGSHSLIRPSANSGPVAFVEPVDIDPGQTVLISLKGNAIDVVDLLLDEESLESRIDLNLTGETVASNFDLLNTFEAMAQ